VSWGSEEQRRKFSPLSNCQLTCNDLSNFGFVKVDLLRHSDCFHVASIQPKTANSALELKWVGHRLGKDPVGLFSGVTVHEIVFAVAKQNPVRIADRASTSLNRILVAASTLNADCSSAVRPLRLVSRYRMLTVTKPTSRSPLAHVLSGRRRGSKRIVPVT
jgi:hypothetical protein